MSCEGCVARVGEAMEGIRTWVRRVEKGRVEWWYDEIVLMEGTRTLSNCDI